MIFRTAAFTLLGLLATTVPASAECDVTLKQTDGYQELSAKLKCLKDEIDALKKGNTSTDTTPAILKRPASARSMEALNGQLRVELTKCSVSEGRGNIQCNFGLTNLTKEDKKTCFGANSRVVTETGATFSLTTGLTAKVGSVEGDIYNKDRSICDVITPLSRSAATLWFQNSKSAARGTIQFLRLDCGAGCAYEAYDIPID